MTISRLSCPKTSAVSAVNASPQFRPGVLVVEAYASGGAMPDTL